MFIVPLLLYFRKIIHQLMRKTIKTIKTINNNVFTRYYTILVMYTIFCDIPHIIRISKVLEFIHTKKININQY